MSKLKGQVRIIKYDFFSFRDMLQASYLLATDTNDRIDSAIQEANYYIDDGTFNSENYEERKAAWGSLLNQAIVQLETAIERGNKIA